MRSHAERVVVLLGDEVVADHPRNFQRERIFPRPLALPAGIDEEARRLRNGAPFKDWDLPAALIQVRAKLKPHADGDRQFVKILARFSTSWAPRCRGRLRRGAGGGDRQRRCDSDRAGASAATRGDAQHHHPRRASPEDRTRGDCGRYDRIRSIA